MSLQPITILFADIAGSTKLFEKLGDVGARAITSAVLSVLTEITQQHGGRVIKTIGDELMCTFPGPMAGIMAAIDMQRRVHGDLIWQRDFLAVRIGLHHGEALLEEGDVYGDAVNTAARMTQMAKREQIVTTLTTIQGMSNSSMIRTRHLGDVRVAGKHNPVEIVDVIWQEDTSNVTMVARAIRLDDAPAGAKLTLRFRGQLIELSSLAPPFGLGRDPGSSLVIDNEWVSRNHATIEFRRGYFVLTDRSTNGTYLRLDDDDELRLHRDEVQLRKSGKISLGQSTDKDSTDVLYFQCSG
ncbi:MAG: adenylate/guanylate cyclase domain-containing protein [Lysobacterales bacterium]|nr:adenylate/guanylate cyclase domain-containing protein [Xanthomonadales bacterium]MCB1612030.1 adenylate/guanylate cyclase domain-containing protein [Xanthomonadales bacterium]